MKKAIGLFTALLFTTFFASFAFAATIYTDKTDYSPSEIVTITGEGFNPSSGITLTVVDPAGYTSYVFSSTDSNGVFVAYYGPNLISGIYSIIASDGVNSVQITFTDSINSNIVCTSDSDCFNQCDASYWYYTGGDCHSGHCRYDNRVCADSSSSDNIPNVGGVRTCSAVCDQNTDCTNICDGKKTGTPTCNNDCTCGVTSASCLKDSCGATCDSDTYCKCLGHKWAPSAACGSSSCSCNNQENAACKIDKCGAQCDATNPCPVGQTCNSDCQCIVTQTCGNGIVEGTEQCDPGTNNPSDCCSSNCMYESSSYTCRSASGTCDVAETCSGSSATCPVDAVQPNTFTCRASQGVCDLEEKCDGSTKTCPTDLKSTALCRASARDCDLAEYCDGVNNGCPTDVFKSSSVVCRSASGSCDIAETCSGSGVNCPADAVRPNGYVCAQELGQCDADDTCDGTHTYCNENYASSGTSCNDGLFCNVGETCNGAGICTGGSAKDCSDSVDCTVDSCNEATDSCDHTANDNFCDDGNFCTSDSCGLLGCQHTQELGCCNSNVDCTNPNICTNTVCTDHTCVSTSIPGCCLTDKDCKRGYECANNSCRPKQVPSMSPIAMIMLLGSLAAIGTKSIKV